jgi:hypothetical protein
MGAELDSTWFTWGIPMLIRRVKGCFVLDKKYFLLTFLASLASCSSNNDLSNGYVIYDLGGSNQILSGNKGMTTVADVTAFLDTNKYILVESSRSSIYQLCKYTVVSTKSGKQYTFNDNDVKRLNIPLYLRDHGEIIIPRRSCANDL